MAEIRYNLTAQVGQKTKKGTVVTQKQASAAEAESTDYLIIMENNARAVVEAINTAMATALEECGLAGERFAKLATPVDTGRLRNSITHIIAPDENAVYLGTNVEYAPYVELGVHGRKGKHMLYNAGAKHESFYRQIFEKHLRGK